MDSLVSAAAACGIAAIIGSTGRVHPMTPVELGNTWRELKPSTSAAAAQIFSDVSTPPGAQTFEILLLMMIAPSVGSLSRLRPMITGAPGNALRVNIAANAVVGCSRAMSVRVIFAGFGASFGMNSKRVQPTRNPLGNAA